MPPALYREKQENQKWIIGGFGGLKKEKAEVSESLKKEGTSETLLLLRCYEAQERVIFPGSFSALVCWFTCCPGRTAREQRGTGSEQVQKAEVSESIKRKPEKSNALKKEGTSGKVLLLRCCEAQEAVIFCRTFSGLRYALALDEQRGNSEEQVQKRVIEQNANNRQTHEEAPRNSRGTVEKAARKP